MPYNHYLPSTNNFENRNPPSQNKSTNTFKLLRDSQDLIDMIAEQVCEQFKKGQWKNDLCELLFLFFFRLFLDFKFKTFLTVDNKLIAGTNSLQKGGFITNPPRESRKSITKTLRRRRGLITCGMARKNPLLNKSSLNTAIVGIIRMLFSKGWRLHARISCRISPYMLHVDHTQGLRRL